MKQIAAAALGAVLGIGAFASPAQAELVFFSSGRTMSVTSHRIDGSNVVLMPRDGGEITVEASIISRIGADELPYPEAIESGPDDGVRFSADAGPIIGAGSQFDEIINKSAAEQGVDARLVHAVIEVESGYQARARSPKGAMGLMQIMPATARQYSVSDPYEPAANIRAGIQHLKSLLERFPLTLALAAYNAGEATVQRFRGMPPYPETRSYVQRILQLAAR